MRPSPEPRGPRSLAARHGPFLVLLLAFLAFAWVTRFQWGLTTDEPDVYLRGMRLAQYFQGQNRDVLTPKVFYADGDGDLLYCHLYALLLYPFNPSLQASTAHFLNLAFAGLLLLAGYGLLWSVTRSKWMSLLGPAFLILSPRLFGNLPNDPKDGAFAVVYLLALAWIVVSAPRRPWIRCVLGALLTGLAVSLRPMGATIPFLYALHHAWENRIHPKKPKGTGPQGKAVLVEPALMAAGGFVLLLAFWPYLLQDFPSHLLPLIQRTLAFPHGGTELFFGRNIPVGQFPWWYWTAWLGLGTPVFLLALSVLGLVGLGSLGSHPAGRLTAAALVLNLLALTLLRPVCYDTMRHFLFLWPILSIVAALALTGLWAKWKRVPRALLAALTMAGALSAGIDLVALHPYQSLYYSEWVGGLQKVEDRFPTDYWGASLGEGLGWLSQNELTDQAKTYHVAFCGVTAVPAVYYLPTNAKWTALPEEADYFVGTSCAEDPPLAYAQLIHQVVREGLPLLSIYRLPKLPMPPPRKSPPPGARSRTGPLPTRAPGGPSPP